MHREQTLELLARKRLVAILRMDDLSQAVSISCALAAGGIAVQEFTLTNRAALQAVPTVKQALQQRGMECSIGIGSVRSREEADEAIASGADFIVSPITRIDVIARCVQAKIPTMPGAMTPTEIATAWDAGADAVKVFPARGLGPNYIKDVLAPMPYLKLMPTGGVDLKNMATYFSAGAVAVGIGGNLIDPVALKNSDWDAISNSAAEYARAASDE